MPRNRAATEQRLLQAVRRILEESGFAHLGINAIADRAGVDKVLIYRYFGGVPGLLAVIGEEEFFPPSGELPELLRAPANSPPGPSGDPAIDFYLRWVEHRPILRQLFLWENATDPNPLIRQFQTHRRAFEEILLEYVAPKLTATWEQWFPGNPRARATGLSVFILGWLHFHHLQETDFQQPSPVLPPPRTLPPSRPPTAPESGPPRQRRNSAKTAAKTDLPEVPVVVPDPVDDRLPDVLL